MNERQFYALANMQLETQKRVAGCEGCVPYDSFMYCQICMLEVIVCQTTGFIFTPFCNKENVC